MKRKMCILFGMTNEKWEIHKLDQWRGALWEKGWALMAHELPAFILFYIDTSVGRGRLSLRRTTRRPHIRTFRQIWAESSAPRFCVALSQNETHLRSRAHHASIRVIQIQLFPSKYAYKTTYVLLQLSSDPLLRIKNLSQLHTTRLQILIIFMRSFICWIWFSYLTVNKICIFKHFCEILSWIFWIKLKYNVFHLVCNIWVFVKFLMVQLLFFF